MPLNALGWSDLEDMNLVDLVKPHSCLYNALDPSKKNFLTRESTWLAIAKAIDKPVEECKKRWRGIRDGYMRNKRNGTLSKNKPMFEKLQFLNGTSLDFDSSVVLDVAMEEVIEEQNNKDSVKNENAVLVDSLSESEQEVVTDNQEYYEITVVDTPYENQVKLPKKSLPSSSKVKGKRGRKKYTPLQPNYDSPIKILPKPSSSHIVSNSNGPKLIKFLNEKKPETKSKTVDSLIQQILDENTNEIDIFFKCMATSVKKLHPSLIPKVKMEVCNVIAKYEMQNYDNKKDSSNNN